MVFTFDLTTNIGVVRLIIPDRVTPDHFFEDEEIAVFLANEDGVKRAAALALETIASDQAMTMKVMKLMDLSTDGAKVSDALLARAQKLRDHADAEEAETLSFDIAEWVVNDFSLREKITKEALRGD